MFFDYICIYIYMYIHGTGWHLDPNPERLARPTDPGKPPLSGEVAMLPWSGSTRCLRVWG